MRREERRVSARACPPDITLMRVVMEMDADDRLMIGSRSGMCEIRAIRTPGKHWAAVPQICLFPSRTHVSKLPLDSYHAA